MLSYLLAMLVSWVLNVLKGFGLPQSVAHVRSHTNPLDYAKSSLSRAYKRREGIQLGQQQNSNVGGRGTALKIASTNHVRTDSRIFLQELRNYAACVSCRGGRGVYDKPQEKVR